MQAQFRIGGMTHTGCQLIKKQSGSLESKKLNHDAMHYHQQSKTTKEQISPEIFISDLSKQHSRYLSPHARSPLFINFLPEMINADKRISHFYFSFRSSHGEAICSAKTNAPAECDPSTQSADFCIPPHDADGFVSAPHRACIKLNYSTRNMMWCD
jgi:hypothetical protein